MAVRVAPATTCAPRYLQVTDPMNLQEREEWLKRAVYAGDPVEHSAARRRRQRRKLQPAISRQLLLEPRGLRRGRLFAGWRPSAEFRVQLRARAQFPLPARPLAVDGDDDGNQVDDDRERQERPRESRLVQLSGPGPGPLVASAIWASSTSRAPRPGFSTTERRRPVLSPMTGRRTTDCATTICRNRSSIR